MLAILLAALESEADKQKFTDIYEQYHPQMEQTALRISLPKGHPSHFHPVLLIDFRVRTGDVPAEHGARFHGFLLCEGNAKPLVVIVRQLTIMRGIVRVPITVVVADLTALDADELAGAGERGEAQLRQSFRQLGGEKLLFRLDAPLV